MSLKTESLIVSFIAIAAIYVSMVVIWKVIALISTAFTPWIGGGILCFLFVNKLFA